MGTWGAGSFDNDAASDWAAELADGGDLELVRATLETAARCPLDEYLESDEGAEALAAAEVVAAAMGRPVRSIEMGTAGPHAVAWGRAHAAAAKQDVVDLALEAVDRVDAAQSELQELWSDAEDAEWFSEVEDLRNRLLAG